MKKNGATLVALVVSLVVVGASAQAQTESWDKDIGKEAPRLFPAGWVGTPVSLDALRKSQVNATEGADSSSTVVRKSEIGGGNTVVLAFWNADIPC
jgi:hypothetical protein